MPHPALRHATVCLRRAETLAGIVGSVSGLADSPPETLSDEWTRDWIERGKRALDEAWERVKREAEADRDAAKKLYEAAKQPIVTAKESAKRIAANVKSGAQAIIDAPGNLAEWARDKLEKLVRIAQIIEWTFLGGTVLATIVLGYFGYRFAEKQGWI